MAIGDNGYVSFRRGTTEEIQNAPIIDGQILFATDTTDIYLDNANLQEYPRIKYRGDRSAEDIQYSNTKLPQLLDNPTDVQGVVDEVANRVYMKNAITIPTTAWGDTSDIGDEYGKKAFITIANPNLPQFVSQENAIANVYFSAIDSLSGNFAPICITTNTGVFIYAKQTPLTETVVDIVINYF